VRKVLLACGAGLVGIGTVACTATRTAAPIAFSVTVPDAVRKDPLTGRVFVFISHDSTPEPRLAAGGASGSAPTPFFGVDVDTLPSGQAAVVSDTTPGYPVTSLRALPAGDYYVQALANVYTEFHRSDGHTVWAHMDQWEGQHFTRAPGNLVSTVRRVHLDPTTGYDVRLQLTRVLPPVAPPPDTKWVKHIKIQSDLLTKFWGHPMYIGAVVLLPDGYDAEPNRHYPVLYTQGHFGLNPPLGFSTDSTPEPARIVAATAGYHRESGFAFYKEWTSPNFPRVIAITFQHPTPYYDDSYAVNSANNGPYGDAIMQELIPAVESRVRAIREPWARILTGGSTGGWIALAHQIFYPDFYGGTFALCPDSVDFRYHQIVNIYDDQNAYYIPGRTEWVTLERPDTRKPDGNITSMMKDENRYEAVVGDHSRSGGQWDIWEATYGPVGPDGYPQRIWDKQTGVIDKGVAAYWKQHFDLRSILATNWSTLGPKVASKINVYVGDADTYYLNMGVHLLNDFLTTADHPKWTGEIVFQPMAPHCWGPRGADLTAKIAAQITTFAPAGADVTRWKY
jgi:putative esterase